MSGGAHMATGKRMDAWSRRKAKVAEQEAAEARALEAREAAAREAALAEKTDAEICAELNLPDPDTLRPGDDFTAFLQKEVPERLRRLALRKLWRSDPLLANVDGLVDYGEDFTITQSAGEVIATAYQVGKGFAAPLVEEAAELAEAEVQPGEEATVAAGDVPEPEPEAASEGLEVTEAELPAAEADVTPEAEPAPQASSRRHMRFEFSDQETSTI